MLPCSHQSHIFSIDFSVPRISSSQVVYYLGPFCKAFHQSSGIPNLSLSLTQSVLLTH